MNRFQKIINRITPRFIRQSVIKNYQTNSNFKQWFGKTFFGIENSTLETNENIFSVVSRLANTVSSLPFKKYLSYEQQFDESMDKLMYWPNNNQTLDQIFNVMEVSRNTNGNGYALIFRDIRGLFEQLVPFNPNYVEPVLEETTNELWCRVSNNGKTYFFHNSDMIHVRHIAGNGNWKVDLEKEREGSRKEREEYFKTINGMQDILNDRLEGIDSSMREINTRVGFLIKKE